MLPRTVQNLLVMAYIRTWIWHWLTRHVSTAQLALNQRQHRKSKQEPVLQPIEDRQLFTQRIV
jgi:hypothetical protein